MRRFLLLACNITYFVRVTFTLFYFLNRKVDWSEVGAISFGLIIYQIGLAILGSMSSNPIDFIDYIALFLFGYGSYLNTFSEYQRKRRQEWLKMN